MQGQTASKILKPHLHIAQENCISVTCVIFILQSCPSHGTSWHHPTLHGIGNATWMLSTIKRCMTRHATDISSPLIYWLEWFSCSVRSSGNIPSTIGQRHGRRLQHNKPTTVSLHIRSNTSIQWLPLISSNKQYVCNIICLTITAVNDRN